MITPDSLRRREYKYLISEESAERIRRFIRGICIVDEHAARTGGRYLTDTLYLDTLQLHSYRATIENSPDRAKLRIRRYPSAGPGGPVFFEVKRRVSESILKTRGSFTGDWQRLLLDTDPEILAQVPAKSRPAIDNFLCHHRQLPMQPCVLVRYEREPYASEIDDYARVTFDRQLVFQRPAELSLEPVDDHWISIDDAVGQRGLMPFHSAVVLELKFTSLVPDWMRRMVHSLDLQRLAFCKYTRSVEAMYRVPGWRIARAGLRT